MKPVAGLDLGEQQTRYQKSGQNKKEINAGSAEMQNRIFRTGIVVNDHGENRDPAKHVQCLVSHHTQ